MNNMEDMTSAQNESKAIEKIAIEAKNKRIKNGEKEGNPTREDYENADKSLTQELFEFIKEGSGEFDKISEDIEKKFRTRMEKPSNQEKKPKRLLILECTGMDELLGKLTVLSDDRLDATSIDMTDVTNEVENLPSDFEEIAGIIITGSPADIVEKEQKPWIGKVEEFIKKALDQNIPTLGVCFGIQVHADLRGREVPKNKGGREMGVWDTRIYLSEKEASHPIFKGINFKEERNEQRGMKSASLKTLGSHAYCVEYDPKAQAETLHGFHFTEGGNCYPMIETDGSFVGLQFHPEMSISEGIAVLQSLVKKRSDKLVADGKDPKKILEELDKYKVELNSNETPDNVKFLRNFISISLDEKQK